MSDISRHIFISPPWSHGFVRAPWLFKFWTEIVRRFLAAFLPMSALAHFSGQLLGSLHSAQLLRVTVVTSRVISTWCHCVQVWPLRWFMRLLVSLSPPSPTPFPWPSCSESPWPGWSCFFFSIPFLPQFAPPIRWLPAVLTLSLLQALCLLTFPPIHAFFSGSAIFYLRAYLAVAHSVWIMLYKVQTQCFAGTFLAWLP